MGIINLTERWKKLQEGGQGSGHWGHKGIHGQKGGSAPDDGGSLLDKFMSELTGDKKISMISAGKLSHQQMLRLAHDPIYAVRRELAISSQTTPEILTIMSRDASDGVRSMVAGNPKTPLDVAEKLSKDTEEVVRKFVAGRSDISQETLNNLSRDNNTYVRAEVAINKNTSDTILESMSRDTSDYVREKVVQNNNINTDTLKHMAVDDSDIIREAVAMNIKTDDKTLEMLRMVDSSKSVQSIARITQELKVNADAIKEGRYSDIKFSTELEKEIKNNQGTRDDPTKITQQILSQASQIRGLGEEDRGLRTGWLGTSNPREALLLKDAMIKSGLSDAEIVHHDAVNNEKELAWALEQSYKLQQTTPEKVQEYVNLAYGINQKLLDIKYPNQDNFTVYRGTSISELEDASRDPFVNFNPESGEPIAIHQNPISSYSLDRKVAEKFAVRNSQVPVVINYKVPKKEIFASYLTYAYSGNEKEIIVLGKHNRVGSFYKVKGED